MKHIAILDFGSQYTHLIARCIREQGVLATIYNTEVRPEELKSKEAIGIVLSGGPQSVYGKKSPKVDDHILNLGIPVLGICFGHQFLAHSLGGKVQQGKIGEYGPANLEILNESKILSGVSSKSRVWMSHGDSVMDVPKGFEISAKTDDCDVAVMSDKKNNFFGFQFHPEVIHSAQGKKMLENFVLKICRAEKNWKIENVMEELVVKIQKKVGNKKVFILISGGVDSNVSFALLTKALGEDRVKGLYIDTGFMRKDESKKIKNRFKQVGFKNLESIDASDNFLGKLEGIYNPEKKRKIIGQTFLDIKEEVVKKMGLDQEHWLFGQGTIYPDTIESGGTKNSQTIKTHHNRVDAITKMIEQGLVVEPIVDLYKDEVRQVGRLLDLPSELVDRHPFPGPGLAIRCLCQNKEDLVENDLAETKKKVNEIIYSRHKNIDFSLLPIRSVGVQGDNRTYAHPLAVWGENDWGRLDEIAHSTTNATKEINRVVYLLNPEEQSTEFYPCAESVWLSQERVQLLREIDGLVNEIIRQEGIYPKIDQFPVVLIPVCDKKGRESIVLRPINTRDFMTLHFFRMKSEILEKIIKAILATGKIGYVFYDVTNKPPGTTEWE